MPKSRTMRVDLDTYERADRLAKGLSDGPDGVQATPRDAVRFAVETYEALIHVVGSTLDAEEVIEVNAEGLVRAFTRHVAGLIKRQLPVDPLAVELARTMPGETPESVAGFSVELLARALGVIGLAGLGVTKPTEQSADDVLALYAKAALKIASAAAIQKPQMRVEA